MSHRSISPKRIFLYLSKYFGLFFLSRYLTRRGLRILCYHGFSLDDESSFRPKLFIRQETFRRRLELLRARGYPILSLETALRCLDCGDQPNGATVITIDDGYYSTQKIACTLLNEFSAPATIYVTTYYSMKDTPVFRLVVQYIFWKTVEESLNLSDLDRSLSGSFLLSNVEDKENVTWRVIRFGEERCSEHQRIALAKRLGELLSVDFEEICKARKLSLLNGKEIQYLAVHDRDIDIQLHTHRHRLPAEEPNAINEINENRNFLEPLVGKKLQHLCYPSGEWSEEWWLWLSAAGIKSAVTCEAGLNYAETPRLGLKRFLDGGNITQIEFEAELAGYSELLRQVRSGWRRLWTLRTT